jgi:uncharacterized circularly permuted ATP-grasp superfamily protein
MDYDKLFSDYPIDSKVWDEMFSKNKVREPYKRILQFLKQLSPEELSQKEEMARRLFMSQGVTFTVYSSGEGIEKIFPFDVIPRIITSTEWSYIEKGIKQRLRALNLFLNDIYSNQFILKDKIIPIDLIYSCEHFLREMHNLKVPHNIFVHISGIDIIRDSDGTFYVLEDNLRTPSGVSYMLENREITKRIFPDLLPQNSVKPVTNYPQILYKNLAVLSPRHNSNPNIVMLTPGIYNSAYFEHSTLARSNGD